MLDDIRGIHHVTSMASNALTVDSFFTRILGLRRVKQTVNFDAPDVYHLYYGDRTGSPGSVMTYFPFPNIARGKPGIGEVGETRYAVPSGALDYWARHLAAAGVAVSEPDLLFDAPRLRFAGPDGDAFALVEAPDDARTPWQADGIPADVAIRGFHSASLRLADPTAEAELLRFMGFAEAGTDGALTRYRRDGGNPAREIDLERAPDAPEARLGAGSVHHIAFSVADRTAHARVRQALADAGAGITPQIDRDYFWAVYFRTPGGVLFEVATDEPGFTRDEPIEELGEALKLPSQHEHLRAKLERTLTPLAQP